MATNWVDEVLSGATSTASKTLSLATGNILSVANSSSESIFTVTSDTTNGGYTSILGIEGQEAVLFLGADNADDAGDAWEVHSDTSGNFKIGNRTSGTGSPTRGNTFTNALSIDSSRNATIAGDLTVTGGRITFANGAIAHNETSNILQFSGENFYEFVATSGGQCKINLHADAAEDNADKVQLRVADGGTTSFRSYVGGSSYASTIEWDTSGNFTTAGYIDITDATDSSDDSGDTGALRCEGGASIAKKLYVGTDLDVDGTANLDAVDIDGAVQIDNTVTVGASDTGYDVKFFGDTASNYMLWDTSDDLLQITTTHNSTALRVQSDATRSTADAPDIVIYKNSNSATNDYLGSVKFNSKDDGGGVHTFAEIDTFAIDSTAGGEEGGMFFNVLAAASSTQALKLRGTSDGLSEVECTDGLLQLGVNTVTQGKLIMKRKDADEFPYIEMVSADGTSSFLFVANDGTLRIHSAAPTANGDGAAV